VNSPVVQPFLQGDDRRGFRGREHSPSRGLAQFIALPPGSILRVQSDRSAQRFERNAFAKKVEQAGDDPRDLGREGQRADVGGRQIGWVREGGTEASNASPSR